MIDAGRHPRPQSRMPEIDVRVLMIEHASGLMNEAYLRVVPCHLGPTDLPVLVSAFQLIIGLPVSKLLAQSRCIEWYDAAVWNVPTAKSVGRSWSH